MRRRWRPILPLIQNITGQVANSKTKTQSGITTDRKLYVKPLNFSWEMPAGTALRTASLLFENRLWGNRLIRSCALASESYSLKNSQCPRPKRNSTTFEESDQISHHQPVQILAIQTMVATMQAKMSDHKIRRETTLLNAPQSSDSFFEAIGVI